MDNALFHGLSAGARIDLTRAMTLYATTGRSRRTDDRRPVMESYGGIGDTHSPVWLANGRSLFAFRRDYRRRRVPFCIALQRKFNRWRVELQVGDQALRSTLIAGAAVEVRHSKRWTGLLVASSWDNRNAIPGGSQYYDQVTGSSGLSVLKDRGQ